MHRSNTFRVFSFIIGLAMLLAGILVSFGVSLVPEANNIGLTGSVLIGAYFVFYAVTGITNIFKYLKTDQT